MHAILRELSVSAGVTIQNNATVVTASSGAHSHYTDSTETPPCSITLANGETLFADVIVGADGPFSAVRRTVETDNMFPHVPVWDGIVRFVGQIPMEAMLVDEDLCDEDMTFRTPIWCGAPDSAIGQSQTL